MKAATELGVVFPVSTHETMKPLTNKLRAAQAGSQPRGNLLPPVLSEFATIIETPWPFSYASIPRRMLTSHELEVLRISQPTKIFVSRGVV